MYLSRYLKIYPVKHRPDHFLVYSTLRSSVAVVPGDTLRSIQSGAAAAAECEALARLGVLVEDADAEKEQMRGMVDRINSRFRHFKPMVVLNLDCNLNCGYCYEEEFRCGRYMTEQTADLLVETLLRDRISKGWDVTVSFYGGEPLLSQDLIRRISEPLLQGADRHGVKYCFTLVTNGTLLNRDAAKKLLPLGLRGAKFTLDGPREIHDGQRPYTSGAGSFDTIVHNLAEIWDLVPIQLGGNFRQENYREFPRMLDHLVSLGLCGEKIPHVQFTPVTPKAGCSEQGSGCASSSEPWLVEALLYLREETLARGFRTSKPAVNLCIVELEDNVVVNCEGRFFKCPAFMGDERMSIGSLADGMKEYGETHGIGNWKIEECLDCSYLPLCFGGCRYITRVQGRELKEVDCRREFFDATQEQMLLQNIAYPATPVKASPAKAAPAAGAPAY